MGLLTGPHLSEVAVVGVHVLMHADALAHVSQWGRQVPAARGGESEDLFSERLGAVQEVVQPEEARDVSEDYDKVAWTVPTMEEWAKTQALLANDRVQVPTPDSGWV